MKFAVIGGCGHVGLPLSLVLAKNGHEVFAIDSLQEKVDLVNSGQMPFFEDGFDTILVNTLKDNTFAATSSLSEVKNSEFIIVVIGTNLDEYMNPEPDLIFDLVNDLIPFLDETKKVILRSTIFPGLTKKIENLLKEKIPNIKVAFCPERIAEGKALQELTTLPQIIGCRDEETFYIFKKVFDILGVKSIKSTPEEAELAKLFTNSWRYLKFAITNQFFMMANDFEVDYSNVRRLIVEDYPRAQDLPMAGFAAGPCLLKDTMQLGAFSDNNFTMGQAAMLINEGLPNYLVNKLSVNRNLENLSIGILGMAFKAESDDPRASLSYKLKKILEFNCRKVLCHDPYIKDERFSNLEYVIENSDLLIMATPHSVYKNIKTPKPLINIWENKFIQ
jgi:UDP-N-acetyl-D-mannosaminuronic acid dehydrogenase